MGRGNPALKCSELFLPDSGATWDGMMTTDRIDEATVKSKALPDKLVWVPMRGPVLLCPLCPWISQTSESLIELQVFSLGHFRGEHQDGKAEE